LEAKKFVQSPEKRYEFPSTFGHSDRRKIHEIADMFGLIHYSRGARGQRILTVEKPGTPTQNEWQDFGYVGLFGPLVDATAQRGVEIVPQVDIQRRVHLDPLAHITLITKEEKTNLMFGSLSVDQFKHLGEEKLKGEKAEILMNIVSAEVYDDWKDLGLGKIEDKYNVVWFKVVEWDSAAKLRAKLGLAPKDFHINVGVHGSDILTMRKDKSTLIS